MHPVDTELHDLVEDGILRLSTSEHVDVSRDYVVGVLDQIYLLFVHKDNEQIPYEERLIRDFKIPMKIVRALTSNPSINCEGVYNTKGFAGSPLRFDYCNRSVRYFECGVSSYRKSCHVFRSDELREQEIQTIQDNQCPRCGFTIDRITQPRYEKRLAELFGDM